MYIYGISNVHLHTACMLRAGELALRTKNGLSPPPIQSVLAYKMILTTIPRWPTYVRITSSAALVKRKNWQLWSSIKKRVRKRIAAVFLSRILACNSSKRKRLVT